VVFVIEVIFLVLAIIVLMPSVWMRRARKKALDAPA